ncbi:related to O-methyltransferase B [Fusarium torulosum]|uniref:Related to O-methyltransferase B n=1 Tax=Fusarium torulosum TaxID=33205 RepID=A0AAE8SPF9_9HYPO|nr:related to O-methyltransferase B [Fusarium torulosum]
MSHTTKTEQAAIDSALAQARELVRSLEAFDSPGNNRLSLLKRVRNIGTVLEEPFDVATRWLETISTTSALHVLIRIKAFEKLPAQGSIAASDIASECYVDVSIITRTMRILIANGIANETQKDEYSHNALSRAFLPTEYGSMTCMFVEFSRALAALPDYVKSHKPEELFDLKKTPFAFSVGCEGKTYYEVYDLDPQKRKLWDIGMQKLGNHIPVTGLFPFEDLKHQVMKQPERPFVVDIGGGRGQALLAIQEHCKGSFGGKLILQDLPIVLDSLMLDEIPGIEPMPYSIFTPQPVKNAHIYLFRHLLMDYPDAKAVEILKNTVPAMGPESRLIINEMLVPDRVTEGDQQMVYLFDIMLLAMCGRERSLSEYRHIFDVVGLELVAEHRSKGSQAVMLETRLKS